MRKIAASPIRQDNGVHFGKNIKSFNFDFIANVLSFSIITIGVSDATHSNICCVRY